MSGSQIIWSCPLCQRPLLRDGRVLICDNNHNFDLAREDYVNLISTGKKLSETVGDSSAMLIARRAFLDAGHYEPLRNRLIEMVGSFTPKVVGDLGCGEGWYVGGIAQALPQALCFGTDIARFGVRMAARAYPAVSFAAADTNDNLPLADQAVDVLLNVFAPRNPAEFNRVLATTGRLFVVIPSADHLESLRVRERLIGIQADKQEAVIAAMSGDFKQVASEHLTIGLDLDQQAVSWLIGMTPNARFNVGDIVYEPLQTTASFDIVTFERLA